MKDITKFWFLKDFNLFKKMGKRNLMAMCHVLEMINVKRGEVLHLSREDKRLVYFVKSGTVKIITEETAHTRSILKMGNIFGELAIYEDSSEGTTSEKAVVLENGVVCFIESEQMKMMIEKYSSLKNQLLKLQGIKIKRLQRNLEDLLYKDSETRIKEYVLNYIHEFGKEKENYIIAKNLISHQDIAHLTNTSRQTVSNVLSKLRKNKIINYNSQELKMRVSSLDNR